MSGAGAIRAGEGYVEVGLNDSALLAGMRRAEGRLKAWGAGLQRVGAGLARAGGLLGAPLLASARLFADFEQVMARVKAVAQPTAAEFKALGDEAFRLGQVTQFTSADAATAMYQFAQAGLSVNDILAATGPTLKLASAAVLTMDQATGAILPVLKGMQLETAQLNRVVDALAATANSTWTDVQLLAAGFSYAGASAVNFGMDLESVAAALGVLSDAGQRGERAGTAVRAVLADFKDLTPKAEAELRRLGVALKEGGNWRPIVDIFRDLGAATKGMGTADRDASLARIFDVRSGDAATILLNNLDRYVELTAKVRASQGTSARMEATLLDTLSGSWKMLTSSVEAFALTAGKAVSPVLRGWADALTGAINAIASMSDENKRLFQTALKVAAGLLAGGAALYLLGAATSGVGSLLGAFVGVLGVVASLIGAATTAVTFLLTPVGGLIAIIVAVVYYSGVLGDVMGWLGDRFTQAAATATKAWGGMARALQAGDLALAAKIAWAGVKVVWYEGLDSVRKAWNDFFSGGGSTSFTLWVNNLVAAFQTKFISLGEWFANLWIGLVRDLRVAWAELAGYMSKKVQEALIRANPFQSDAEGAVLANNARIDAETKGSVAEADAVANKSRSHVKNKSDRLRARFERERAGREVIIKEDAERERKKPAPASEATLAARKELDDLIAAAAKLKAASAEPSEVAKDVKSKLPEMTRGLDDARAKAEVSGTFNPNAVAGLGARSVSERIADATRQTAENTKRLIDQGGGVRVT